MSLLNRDDTLFLAIDFQEKLMPVMSNLPELERTVVKLTSGMKELGIPMIVTQQYTKGLGETVPAVAEIIGEFEPVEKTSFSCLGCPDFVERLEASGKKSIVVCGIEAHICVQQTVLELLERGYNVHLAVDCISSRDEMNKMWAITRMGEAGAKLTTYEAVLYELMRTSKADGFKAISKIVK